MTNLGTVVLHVVELALLLGTAGLRGQSRRRVYQTVSGDRCGSDRALQMMLQLVVQVALVVVVLAGRVQVLALRLLHLVVGQRRRVALVVRVRARGHLRRWQLVHARVGLRRLGLLMLDQLMRRRRLLLLLLLHRARTWLLADRLAFRLVAALVARVSRVAAVALVAFLAAETECVILFLLNF